jgi:uncharacterized GH25 family protein
MRIGSVCLLTVLLPLAATAHDTWVETNTSLVRVGELVHVDLKLGNHGNAHRDFKLASKASLAPTQISVVRPTGESVDLKPHLVDTGLTPKEGYWTARYTTTEPGLHVVAQTSESMHGKTRSLKSGKTYFMGSMKLDEVPTTKSSHDKPLGHALEIVPLSNPVTEMGPGQPIRVKILFQSKPLNGARVSFVPRGAVLDEGFDKNYERETTSEGVASYTPQEGNVILVVVHHSAADQKGDGYDGTSYSSTLTIAVPQLCANCIKVTTSK